jgi:hypothetical protein
MSVNGDSPTGAITEIRRSNQSISAIFKRCRPRSGMPLWFMHVPGAEFERYKAQYRVRMLLRICCELAGKLFFRPETFPFFSQSFLPLFSSDEQQR